MCCGWSSGVFLGAGWTDLRAAATADPLCPAHLDPCPHRLPDRGIWGRVQPTGAEGRASGGDGAVGRHPGRSLCAGPQSADHSLPEGAAEVSAQRAIHILVGWGWGKESPADQLMLHLQGPQPGCGLLSDADLPWFRPPPACLLPTPCPLQTPLCILNA